jgi:signal transduction histidine kinase
MKKVSLFWQLGLSICFLIFLVEGALLFTSIQSRKAELMDMKLVLQQDVMNKTGKNFNELHPGILDEKDIERRMDKFKRNVIFLTLLISFCVMTGTLLVFYFIAGKHIFKLTYLNDKNQNQNHSELPIYSEKNIPNNELGEMIISRNEMLLEIQGYQDNLEEKLEQAKDQLIQATKMGFVGELTASIIHDLKNPMSIVIMNADLMDKQWDNFDDERKRHMLGKIKLGGDRVHEMIERMGKFNRINDNIELNFNQIIDNSILYLNNKITTSNIKVTKDISITQPTIIGSPPALEQVISNLISNACDAMEKTKNAQLLIKTELVNNEYCISITDTGSGIKPEDLKNIFQSFFTTKDIGKGTGLGLSSAQRIIKDHDGKIDVTSILGNGTTFRINFPT